ncbi:hypothetical protein ACFC1R_09955 [Kitasatospora sp. NPDC056138]|uniref:hypothetical protein n=1 Tax=Kitasatospora sp. NPDC056138 TaxID=3345724 RepID=UPI0035DBD3B7
MTVFLMNADAEMTEFFSAIAQVMRDRFGITWAEAVARLNQAWGHLEFAPYPDLVCHEDEEFWAHVLYFEERVPYWDEGADRDRWQIAPPPPAGSDCWTLPDDA